MISGLKHYEKHQEDFGIAMTEEFESEVQDMCNLGKALVEKESNRVSNRKIWILPK